MWRYVASTKPAQNAFVKRCNGHSRDERLSETLFTSMAQARALLAAWRQDYSTITSPARSLAFTDGGC